MYMYVYIYIYLYIYIIHIQILYIVIYYGTRSKIFHIYIYYTMLISLVYNIVIALVIENLNIVELFLYIRRH